jgi:flagellar basal-body rod protein FlgC
MNILSTMNIGSSALSAQSTRLNAISSNLANVNTSETPEGGPYRKKSVVFRSAPAFEDELTTRSEIQGVRVERIVSDDSDPKRVYDPSHPDAGENGYVEMPNINVVEEMTDMMTAARAYEANVTSIKSSQRMAMKALEIGR